jgi:hypothetical protein
MIYRDLRSGAGLVTVRLAAAFGAALLLASCGLISSDVTDVEIRLPDKNFTINTGGWKVSQSDADRFLSQSCSSQPSVCGSEVAQVCPMGCTGSCNAQTCDLSLDISLAQPVNLLTEQPELKSFSNQSVIKVGVDSVTYEVSNNTLNIATPELTVYVAPMSVITADAQATAIGTIPPIPAGQKTTAPQSIVFTAAGRDKLVNVMSAFKTPFNVLVGSSILLTAGQQVPTGQLDAAVHITGHAGL